MAAAPRTSTTPDYLTLPPYALIVADALEAHADTTDKLAQEIGQTRVMAPIVQMLRRAAVQTRTFADDEPQS